MKIKSLPVSWIFEKEQEKYALKFFEAIMEDNIVQRMKNSSDLQYFRIEGLQIFIEFMYENFRYKVATI